MSTHFKYWLQELKTTFWVLPLIMLLLAVFLAIAAINLDGIFSSSDSPSNFWGIQFDSPGNVRAFLTSIGGGMLGTAGILFAITVAVLATVSQQFGPRIIRNFLCDLFNQFVIGLLLGTSLYSFLVLQVVGPADEAIVPTISMSIALLLTFANFLFLIIYIHHFSSSLRAENIVATLYKESLDSLQKMNKRAEAYNYRDKQEQLSQVFDNGYDLPHASDTTVTIETEQSGYLQAIDYKGLVDWATQHNMIIKLAAEAGEYIMGGFPIAYCQTSNGQSRLTDEEAAPIKKYLFMGNDRTPQDDIKYNITQLVDIVLLSLPPVSNDPISANNATRIMLYNA